MDVNGLFHWDIGGYNPVTNQESLILWPIQVTHENGDMIYDMLYIDI